MSGPMAYEDANGAQEVQELGLSTAKRGAVYVGGEIATSFIVLALLIFLARVLQPSSFGLYSIAVSFAALLGIAGNFGMGTAFRKMLPGVREGDAARTRKILANGYSIAMAIGAVIAVVGFLLSGAIARNVYGNPALGAALEIAAIAEFVSVVFNLAQAALVGLGLVKEATIANAAYSASYLVGSVVLVLLGYGVTGAVAGMLIGLAVGGAAGLAFLFRKTGLFVLGTERKTAMEVASFSAPVVASNVAMQGVLNFSVLFLGVFAAASVVGNYGSAFKLARFVDLTIASITFILLAAFSKALSGKGTSERIGTIYNNSLYYTFLLMLPLVAYGIALAKPIVGVLFSSQYSSAPLYFSIMIAGMAVGMIGTYAGTLIIGNGDTRRFMKYQISVVAIEIGLLVLLTPLYKAQGVLVAMFVVAPIVSDIIYIRALREQFRFRHSFGRLASVAASSAILGIAMFAVSYALNQGYAALLVDAVVAAVLFPPLLALTKGIDRKNIDFIRSAGARLRQLHYITDAFAGYTSVFVRDAA